MPLAAIGAAAGGFGDAMRDVLDMNQRGAMARAEFASRDYDRREARDLQRERMELDQSRWNKDLRRRSAERSQTIARDDQLERERREREDRRLKRVEERWKLDHDARTRSDRFDRQIEGTQAVIDMDREKPKFSDYNGDTSRFTSDYEAHRRALRGLAKSYGLEWDDVSDMIDTQMAGQAEMMERARQMIRPPTPTMSLDQAGLMDSSRQLIGPGAPHDPEAGPGVPRPRDEMDERITSAYDTIG